MNLELKPDMSFENMTGVLTRNCPGYKIKLLKNPVARFQYIQVEKSPFVGIWIRIFEKNKSVGLINTMPSTIARVPLLGLIFTLILQGFFNSSQSAVRKKVRDILVKEYNTAEI